MLHPEHKHAFLQALDGVDQEIDRLTLGSKKHTQAARGVIDDEKSELKPDDENVENVEKLAGADPHTSEESLEGADYTDKGGPSHPFGKRGVGGMSRKPLFGKRFAR